jgi:hypothetical protein
MIARRLERFLFFPESDRWVSVLRLGLALQLVSFCLAVRKDWIDLLSLNGRGLINRELMEAALNAESFFIPRLGWMLEMAGRLGLPESAALWLIWSCLLIAALFLLLGLFSRAAAISSWLIHLCVVKSVGYLSYGVDNLTTIGLFYLMIAPLPDRLSLDSVMRNKSARTELLSVFRRILQVHVCLIYFFGGLAKLAGSGWWNGNSLWRALTVPPRSSLSNAPARGGSAHLPAGVRLSFFHLATSNANRLADSCLRDASHDRADHGDVSFRVYHDCSQPGCIYDIPA